jgi:predicted amino acid-binding ACT domain protein
MDEKDYQNFLAGDKNLLTEGKSNAEITVSRIASTINDSVKKLEMLVKKAPNKPEFKEVKTKLEQAMNTLKDGVAQLDVAEALFPEV